MDAIERAVVAPQIKIVESVLRGGRSFGIARPLASRAQHIHDPVHHFAHVDVALVATAPRTAGLNEGDIKTRPIEFAALRFDWRQMQHWGISESSLPAGSTGVLSRATVWERYSWQVALTTAIIVLQPGLSGPSYASIVGVNFPKCRRGNACRNWLMSTASRPLAN